MELWGADDPESTPQCLHCRKSKTKHTLLHFERGCWPVVCLLGADDFEEIAPLTVQIKVIQTRDLSGRS